MAYKLVPKPHMRARLEAAEAYQSSLAAQRAAWEQAKSVIPAGYKSRHGAASGGTVRIDGEAITEPGISAASLPWRRLAIYTERVRDLRTNGRVHREEILYSATVADGRNIYRIASSTGFGDDCRETYWLPEDLWRRMMEAELRMRGITPRAAVEWLSQYRGCVGTELYEFAAALVEEGGEELPAEGRNARLRSLEEHYGAYVTVEEDAEELIASAEKEEQANDN